MRKKGRVVIRDERKGGGFAYRIIMAPSPAAIVSEGKPPASEASDAPAIAAEA